MKRILFSASLLFLFTLGAAAQLKEQNNEGDEYQTLIRRGSKVSHGVYCGFEYAYANIANRSAFLSGFNIAWVIDHTVEIGFVGKGFLTNPLPDLNLDNRNYMYLGGYGGFHFAGTVMGRKPINVSFPVTIGAGGLAYVESINSSGEFETYPENIFAYFVVEPGVDLQLNVTRFFRINAGVAYRYTSDLYLFDSPTSEQLVRDPGALRGLSYSLKFKFGWF